MSSSYSVRTAVPTDLPYLPAIELSASALFRSVPAVAYFAEGEPSQTAEKQARLCAAGTLWVVAEHAAGVEPQPSCRPCAFLAGERVDDCIYISELSVHADYQRRGLAGLLIKAVSNYASRIGLCKVSLMTERDVPWNGPMYRRKGFEEVGYSSLGPGHIDIADHEKEAGMDMSRRAMMILNLNHEDRQPN